MFESQLSPLYDVCCHWHIANISREQVASIKDQKLEEKQQQKKVSSSTKQQHQEGALGQQTRPLCAGGKKWPPYTANKVIAERRLRPPVQHSMLQICPPENKLKSIWLCHTVTILRRITFFLYKKFKFCKESSSCQKCFHPNIVLILHKCGRHPNIAKQKPVNFLWCSHQSCSAAAVPK